MLKITPLLETFDVHRRPKEQKDAHMYRRYMRKGSSVLIVQKPHQRTGELTSGKIGAFLTNKPFHPRGIKVRLEDGTVGRVQKIIRY